jgi:hypothetical protein
MGTVGRPHGVKTSPALYARIARSRRPRATRRARHANRGGGITVPGFSTAPGWNGFVERCVSTWENAHASVREFFDLWAPLPVDLLPPRPAPHVRARRARADVRRAITAHRAGGHSAPPRPLVTTLGVEQANLRQKFPFVTELLVEMAYLDRSDGKRRRRARKG